MTTSGPTGPAPFALFAAAFLATLLAIATPGATAATSLVPGGLTAQPAPFGFGANRVVNGEFQADGGSGVTGWLHDGAWSIDAATFQSGGSSLKLSDAPSFPYIQDAGQLITLGKGMYRMSGWIKTDLAPNTDGWGVRIRFDTSGANQGGGASTPVITGTTEWTRFEIRDIVVRAAVTAHLKLEAYGEPAGQAWFDDVRVEEQLPPPLSVFMLYPNFRGMLFDDQSQQLRFDVTVAPPSGNPSDYDIVIDLRGEDGTPLRSTRYQAAPSLVAEIDGSGMTVGVPYLATATLVDRATGGVVYAHPAYRVSRTPASARATMAISADEKNRILVYGRPRFVLGVFDAGLPYSPVESFWDDLLFSPTGARRMGNLRINFYLNYHFGAAGADSMRTLMSSLHKHGIMYLQTGNCFEDWRDATAAIDLSDAYVQDIGSHIGSAGYYVADECRSSQVQGTFAQYQRLKSLDPDSMTLASLLANMTPLELWRDAVDVLMTDPYPLWGAEPAAGYVHSMVADWAVMTREAVKDSRPWFMDLQFFQATGNSRWPTREEMRNHAYMAIVEGAKGLWWWSLGVRALAWVCPDWCDEKVAHMQDLEAVVGELAELEPVLLADDRPELLAGNSQAAAIRTKVKVVGDRAYVFAYNYTATTTPMTLTWSSDLGSVNVVGEGRSLAGVGRTFTDTFGPYQAHVYEIAASTPLVPLAPSGTVDTATPAFSWTAMSGVSWYQLNVRRADGTLDRRWLEAVDAACGAGVGICTVTTDLILESGDLEWWVFVWNGTGYWSAITPFVVALPAPAPPAEFVALAPSGASAAGPDFTWTRSARSEWYALAVLQADSVVQYHWVHVSEAGCADGSICRTSLGTPLSPGAARWWVFFWDGEGHWTNQLDIVVASP